MNKALEALEKIKFHLDMYVEDDRHFHGDFNQYEWYDSIENALLKTDPLYIIKSTYSSLCGEFTRYCRERPDTPWDQIPEAVAALKTLEEYEAFVLKYYKIDLSPKQENK